MLDSPAPIGFGQAPQHAVLATQPPHVAIFAPGDEALAVGMGLDTGLLDGGDLS